MKDSKITDALGKILLERLSGDELALLRGEIPQTEPGDYDAALAKVRKRLSVLEDQVSRNRKRVRERYTKLEEQSHDRRKLLFENSPPSLLLALAYDLIGQSFAERFGNVRRSLRLAELAVEAAEWVKRTEYLAPEMAADLQGEALGYLGNARRLNSDLAGAERAFDLAEEYRARGTLDRDLRANLLSLLASLRNDQGRAKEAGRLLDREIALRKLLGDEEKLGEALINRGIISPWFEPLGQSCVYLLAGSKIVKNPRLQALALLPLGEALARMGDGLRAWKVACQLDTILVLARAEDLQVRNRAVKGMAYRILGELEDAERELRTVRDEFAAQGRQLQTAIASLELACVYAAQGNLEEVKKLAAEAHAVFVREKLGKETLKASLILQQAAAAERVTEQLAVEVVNFVVRSRYDRSLRFVRASNDGRQR